MLTNEQQLGILSRISTSRMLAVAADLWAMDRRVGGPGLEQVCERTAAGLREAGAHQVELKTYPYGAEHRYFSHRHERRPFTEEAELWLVTPEGSETLVCRMSDDPACSMGSLRSTPTEGEVLEVVDVGFGTRPTDYRSHRLPGRLALASGHHFRAAMFEALVQRQAEGLLCGPGSQVADPSLVVPNRLADPSVFGHRPFGFNLSAHQFNHLVTLLAGGSPVKARVKVRVSLDSGVLPVVSALVEGGELKEQRVLLVAELDADEAPMGVACLQEIVQTISAAVAQGVLPPLRRTLQVLLVPGLPGTVAWLSENRERLGDIKAVVHVTVPTLEAAARVEVELPPPQRPSFIHDLLRDHLRWGSTVQGSYRGDIPMAIQSVFGASGSMLASFVDPEIDLPGVAIRCTGEPGIKQAAAVHHGPFHRLTAAIACAAADLCDLDHGDLPRLISSSFLKGHQRLNQRAEALHDRIERELHCEARSSRAGRHLLWLTETSLKEGLRRESLVLKSCGDYLDGPGPLALGLADATSQLKQLQLSLARTLGMKISGALGPRTRLSLRRNRLSALERRASAVVPRRQLSGPLPAPDLLREADEADRIWLAHHAGVLAGQPVGAVLLRWVDSKRSLLEIYEQICLDYPDADLKLIWRYLEVLRGAGLVELQEDKRVSVPGEAVAAQEDRR